jgi:hypothetical protein
MAMAILHERGALLTGLGVGVGLMYFLDPERGRRVGRSSAIGSRTRHT